MSKRKCQVCGKVVPDNENIHYKEGVAHCKACLSGEGKKSPIAKNDLKECHEVGETVNTKTAEHSTPGLSVMLNLIGIITIIAAIYFASVYWPEASNYSSRYSSDKPAPTVSILILLGGTVNSIVLFSLAQILATVSRLEYQLKEKL